MRGPDRRRRSGRALGATLALVAMAATLWVWAPVARAQTVEPPPSTVEPPPSTVEPPPSTVEPPPPPSTVEPPPQPSDPIGSGTTPPTGGGSGTWSATEIPSWDAEHAVGEDPLRQWRDWTPTPGTFDTASLDRFAERMRERGWREGRIRREVYAPFIVVGPATWSDSWGALRLIAGPRPHHGQDVLCTYGADVLATERGTVTWSTGSLGGLAAYLHRPDGSFYYYAHLSGTPRGLAQGATVEPGDVIGSCGASGDASVPHVHFSYVTAAGISVDPMDRLRRWLRTAELGLPNPPPAQPEEPEIVMPPATTPPAWDVAPTPSLATTSEPPASLVTSAAEALGSPVAVPAAALLLGVPLLGLLRRRTHEPFS